MAKMSLTEIVAVLEARKAEGVIWNPEFVDMKDRLGRLIWNTSDAQRHLLRNVEALLEGRGRKLNFNYVSNSHDLLCTVKKIREHARIAGVTTHETYVAFIDGWAPYTAASELLVSLKPLVKKGRKPNPEAEARKERDMENTGTCGCCGRNIKLGFHSGDIWDHGFAIVNRGYGYAAGYKTGKSCFGVGYQPIELSPACWVDMKAAWVSRVASLPQAITNLEERLAGMDKPVQKLGWQMTKEEKDYAKVYSGVQQALRECKWELTHLQTSAIPEITEKIANWAPKPLPGTRR